jgi:hypothetical protein
MAVRTTALAVSKVIQVDLGLGESLESILEPFIETANQIVNDVCGACDYSDAKFELIERWLAAHFYGCFDPQLLSETAGPVSAAYLWRTGPMLSQTRQGQQAMMLDTSGKLSTWNSQAVKGTGGQVVGVSWLGTSNS